LIGETTPYLGSSYAFYSGVSPGVEYSFMIKAVNKWGSGVFSNTVGIVSAYKPGQMNAIRTSIDASTGDVVVEWDLPDERGDPIFKYEIYF